MKQPTLPGDLMKNLETPGKTGRVGRSATVTTNCRHMVSLVSYEHFMVLENIPNPCPSKKEGSEV